MSYYNYITTFLSVYETSNTLKSSEALNITQSTVSRQINQLEKTLDIKLFERTSGGMIATEQGHDFAKQLRPYYTRIQDVTNTFNQRVVPHLKKKVYIGVPADVLRISVFSEILKLSMKDNYSIIFLSFSTITDLRIALEKKRVHYAIYADNHDVSPKNSTRIYIGEMLCKIVGTKKWCELFHDSIIDNTKLSNLPWASYDETDASMISEFLKQTLDIDFQPTPKLTLADDAALLAAISSGYFIGLLPYDMIKKQLKDFNLFELVPQENGVMYHFVLDYIDSIDSDSSMHQFHSKLLAADLLIYE